MPGTSAIGELVVKFSADIADILSNTEKVQATLENFTSSVTAGLLGLQSSTDSIVTDIQNRLLAFASIDFAASFVGGVISANASLERLNVSTGVSVPVLSAFSNAVAEAGDGSANTARNLQVFARNLETATSGTGNAANALRALGLSYNLIKEESPDDALLSVVNALAKIGSSAGAAADAQALFGRSGAALIPAFQLLAASGVDLATVTDEDAKAANALEGEWNALKVQTAALATILITGLAPTVITLLKVFLDAATGTNSFGVAVKNAGSDNTFATWAENTGRSIAHFIDTLLALPTYLNSIATLLTDAQKAMGDFGSTAAGTALVLAGFATNNLSLVAIGWSKIQTAGKDLDTLLPKLKSDFNTVSDGIKVGTATVDAFNATLTKVKTSLTALSTGTGGGDPVKPVTDGFAKALAAADAYNKALTALAKAGNDATTKVIVDSIANQETDLKRGYDEGLVDAQDYYTQLTSLQQLSSAATIAGLTSDVDVQVKELGNLKQSYADIQASAVGVGTSYKTLADQSDALTKNLTAQATQEAKVVTAQGALQVATQKATEVGKDQYANLVAQNSAYLELVPSIQKQIDAQTLANATLGLTASQTELVKISLAEAKLATLDWDTATQEEIDALTAAIAKMKELVPLLASNEAAKDQITAWQSVLTETDTVFQSIANNGKTTWSDLTTWLKDTLVKELLTLVETQWVIPIIAQLSGTTVAGSIASSLNTSLGSNPFSLLGNSLSSSLTGSITTGIADGVSSLATGSGPFASAAASLIPLGDTAEAATAAIGTFATGLAAAIPYVGIAIAAYELLNSLGVFGTPGGPKVGGSATTGDVSQLSDLGTGNAGAGRFYTPDQADAQLQTTVSTIQTTFATTLAQLGGTAAAVGFALGYDTDPQGNAGNRVSAGVQVGGNAVFQQQNVGAGTDATGLQAGLTQEADRAILAALQASNLPADIADLLNTVVASTATTDQITAIEQVAATYAAINETIAGMSTDVQNHFTAMLDGTQATADNILIVTTLLNSFSSSMAGVGAQIGNLNVGQINAFVSALGGATNATTELTYLYTNFVPASQKLSDATATLNTDFTNLGITTIPQTHQQFLDLLSSIDLTTASGQQLYASLLALAPAFVAVHGTADQATTSITGLSDALNSVNPGLQDFYTTAQKLSDNTTTLNTDFTNLGVAIPQTHAQFLQLLSSIDQTTPAGQALYAAIFALGPLFISVHGTADQAAAALTAANAALAATAAAANSVSQGTIDSASAKFVNTFLSNIQGLASKLVPNDFGSTTSFTIGQITSEIANLKTQYNATIAAAGGQINADADTISEEINSLQSTNSQLAGQLGQFTVLNAQYGSDVANQLVQLQIWYDGQQKILKGNSDALAALQTVFQEQWTSIINGTSTGVSGTQTALQKLQATIFAFVQSLEVGTLSPLTPLAQLTAAQANYNTILAAAQTGDQTALGNIDDAAQSYLTQARAVDASSAAYTSIFNSVIDSLTALAGPAGTIVTDGAGFVSSTATMASAVAGYGSAATQATAAIAAASASAAAATKNATNTVAALPSVVTPTVPAATTAPTTASLTALTAALPAGGKLSSSQDTTALGVKVDAVSKHVQELQATVVALNSASDSRTSRNIAAQKQSTATVVANLPRKGK